MSKQKLVKIEEIEFRSIKEAKLRLSIQQQIEEIFYAITINYGELSSFIAQETIKRSIYRESGVVGMRRSAVRFGALLSNFLSSCRLYLEKIGPTVGEVTKSSESQKHITSEKARKYDENKEYALMEILRNFAQHESLPIYSLRINQSWNDERTDITIEMQFYIALKQFTDNKKLSKSHRKIIEASIDKDLKNAARVYYLSICEIHKTARSEMKQSIDIATDTIRSAQNKWIDETGGSRNDCIYVRSNLLPEEDQICIDSEVFEFLDYMLAEIRLMQNNHKLRIEI